MFKHLQVEMRTFSDFDKLYKYVNILPDVPALPSNQHICLKKLPEVDVRQVSPSAGNSIFLKKVDGISGTSGAYIPHCCLDNHVTIDWFNDEKV